MLADIILSVHVLFILFVVGGQLLIMVGIFLNWHWIRNFYFRLLHFAAIAYVLLESLFGMMCPLTLWENALRREAGEGGYGESFIRYWVHKLVFYEAPGWVFTLVYLLFFSLVVISWVYARPQRNGSSQ